MLAVKPNSKKISLYWHPSYCHHPRKAREHTGSTSVVGVQPTCRWESHVRQIHSAKSQAMSPPNSRKKRPKVLPDEILATAVVLKLEVQDSLMSEQRRCSSPEATAQISYQAPGKANYVRTSILQCDNFLCLTAAVGLVSERKGGDFVMRQLE